MRWTLDEDIQLLVLVRQLFTSLTKHNRLDVSSPFSQQLHAAFNSPHRKISALLFRLRDAKILAFASPPNGNAEQQRFKCLLQDDMPLYDYSVTFPTLKELQNPATVAEILKRFEVSNPQQPVSDTIGEIAVVLSLVPMQVEKILIENDQLCINRYRQLEHSKTSTCHRLGLSDQITKQAPDVALIDEINACRARAAEFYHVHERDGAEVIFSSDGTGFGKSYGVIQGYVEYLERLASTQTPDYLFPKGRFTNLLFMSPQKSQIDLDTRQKERILAAGGEFICVVSRKDTADLAQPRPNKMCCPI